MKRLYYISAVMTSLMLISCVQKEEGMIREAEGNTVKLTIAVDYPEVSPQTKVAFGEGENPQLVWTGDETMALIFGKVGEGGEDNNVCPIIPSVKKGVFSGQVSIPEGYTISDLQGFVIPAESKPVFDWRSATDARIKMSVPVEQTQNLAGEPNWLYSPFFYDLSGISFADNQVDITLDGLTVMSAANMVRLNVYGKHPDMSDDEVLVSVTMRNTKNTITGTAEYTIGSELTNYKNNGSTTAPVVTLTEKQTIADKSKDTGVELYMSIIGRNSHSFDQITVVTDKAVYTKDIEEKSVDSKDVTEFLVYQAGIDLSSGYTRTVSAPKYSIDGGVNWEEEIPEQFTSLAVKGLITEELLSQIKSEICAQEGAVDLDMENASYEVNQFPAVFAGTEDAADTHLKSIKFPSNVDIISASAFRYCAALETVDLKNIVNIGNHAFRNSGLKKISIDKQVTTLGTYACAECYDLEEIYFNSTDSRLGTPASGGTNFYTFSFPEDKIDEHTTDLVVTVGPDSRLPRYGLQYNANLTKIIFESTVTGSAGVEAGRQGNNALKGVHYLSTVITKGNNWLYNGSITEVGKSLPEGTVKYYVVPDGQVETYKEWRMWTGNGDNGALAANGFTIIEQSEYDKLQN